MKKIILVGYGGHAKVVADSIRNCNEYEIVGYTDVEEKKADIKYLGNDLRLRQIYESGVRDAVLGIGYIGNSDVRNDIYNQLKEIGYNLPAIVDKSSVIARGVSVGEGTYIGKRAVINPDSVVDKCCIINTGAIVEHECKIGSFSHISVGTILCGNVSVGENCFIGANATVIQGKNIGNNCLVGAGTVVRKNLRDDERLV